MRKFCYFVLFALLVSFIASACVKEPKASLIKAKRRFAKYVEPQQNHSHDGIIDLSEGPKLKYEANFGPKALNFDIKIQNPY